MEKGYIRLHRKFFANDLWNEARTFSSCEAWLDLIQSARFEATPRKVSIGGREVSYGRGQLPASIRFLAKRWTWTDRHVRTFLNYLKKSGMVDIDKTQNVSIITLVNYDKYNMVEESDTANDTAGDTTKSLLNKDLASKVTQQVTQPLTQPSPKRHTGDTKLIKEKNILLSSSPPSVRPCACTHEDRRQEELYSELRAGDVWLEHPAMRLKMSVETVRSLIDTFRQDCNCYGHVHQDLSDIRTHFFNWLRKHTEKGQTNGNNGNNRQQEIQRQILDTGNRAVDYFERKRQDDLARRTAGMG